MENNRICIFSIEISSSSSFRFLKLSIVAHNVEIEFLCIWKMESYTYCVLFDLILFFYVIYRSDTKRTPAGARKDGYQRASEWHQSRKEQILSGQLECGPFAQRTLSLLS